MLDCLPQKFFLPFRLAIALRVVRTLLLAPRPFFSPHHPVCSMECLRRYRKIQIISPGVIFVRKAILQGLFWGELIFGGAYDWKEFCISKLVGLDNKNSLKDCRNSLKQLTVTVHRLLLGRAYFFLLFFLGGGLIRILQYYNNQTKLLASMKHLWINECRFHDFSPSFLAETCSGNPLGVGKGQWNSSRLRWLSASAGIAAGEQKVTLK